MLSWSTEHQSKGGFLHLFGDSLIVLETLGAPMHKHRLKSRLRWVGNGALGSPLRLDTLQTLSKFAWHHESKIR